MKFTPSPTKHTVLDPHGDARPANRAQVRELLRHADPGTPEHKVRRLLFGRWRRGWRWLP